ncbi:MAG: leucine-rich repeat domain-containing protein [Oscillospiraceae bacterium]|jgi:Leucine-rich repeat (LRR) protein|nr:leucine-rich repeat domain-containing protein [Oscillospiraceae bacterium]
MTNFIKKHKQFSITATLTLIALLVFGAFQLADYIRDGDKSRAELLKERADKYFVTMDYRNAVNFYNMALEADPAFEEIYIILHDYYIGDGNRLAAWEILVRAVENTDSERLRLMLADADYIVVFESEELKSFVFRRLNLEADDELWRSDLDIFLELHWRHTFGDLSQLRHFRNISTLWANGLGISDVTIFTQFTELRELNLDNNKITDISPLASLPNLEQLSFSHNLVSDLSPLKDFKALNYVLLSFNPFLRIDSEAIAHIEKILGLPTVELQDDDDFYVWDLNDDIRQSLLNTYSQNFYIPNSWLEHVDFITIYPSGEMTASTDLRDLKRLPNLNHLYFNNIIFDDFSVLDGLDIKGIGFYNCKITDTLPLSEFKNLHNINFYNCEIIRLTLDDLPLLYSFSIENSDVQLLELSNLPNLNHAFFNSGVFANISPPTGLDSLTMLDLYIDDEHMLSQLSVFTEVIRIQIFADFTIEPSHVAKFGKLTELSLSGSSAGNLSFLSSLPNLRSLTLSTYDVYNSYALSTLPALPNLETLNIFGTAIGAYEKIPDLIGFTNLKTLHLNINRVTDLSPLAGLANLTSLELYGDWYDSTGQGVFVDFAPLSGLTRLTSLEIYMAIFDLSPLAGLINLTSLKLNGDWYDSTGRGVFVDLAPLFGLTRLTSLEIYNMAIFDLSPLSALIDLTHLALINGFIEDISPLAGLVNLIYLGLSRNAISDFSPLAGLTNLLRLDVWGNPGENDLDSIQHILDNLEYWLY